MGKKRSKKEIQAHYLNTQLCKVPGARPLGTEDQLKKIWPTSLISFSFKKRINVT